MKDELYIFTLQKEEHGNFGNLIHLANIIGNIRKYEELGDTSQITYIYETPVDMVSIHETIKGAIRNIDKNKSWSSLQYKLTGMDFCSKELFKPYAEIVANSFPPTNSTERYLFIECVSKEDIKRLKFLKAFHNRSIKIPEHKNRGGRICVIMTIQHNMFGEPELIQKAILNELKGTFSDIYDANFVNRAGDVFSNTTFPVPTSLAMKANKYAGMIRDGFISSEKGKKEEEK